MVGEAPSQLLASALVMQATNTPAQCGSDACTTPSVLASTAACLIELDRCASPRVRLSTSVLRYVLSTTEQGAGWPSSTPSIGESPDGAHFYWPSYLDPSSIATGCDPAARYVNIQSFVIAQLARNFVDIKPEHSVSTSTRWPLLT